MKVDPYNHREKYLKWKEINTPQVLGVSEYNSKIAFQYLGDMEKGINIALGSVKGSRSYCRLNSLRSYIIFFSKKLEELYNLQNITKVTEEQIISLFSGMRDGSIKREDGREYASVADYVKGFKSFWHWHQKKSKKEGIEVPDITVDLDTSKNKPKWVYLTEKEVKQLAENSSFEYKTIIMFLYDTGIRAPTELMNLKVSDFFNDFKEVHIREEVSKTFGRRIKLMISSELVKEYVRSLKLSPDDLFFTKYPYRFNDYLRRIAKKVFGDGKTAAGQKYSELTMYDFRHCSCCYWLPRYKSESALKYRFGWKKSEKIHYYSELLGMRDTISEEDMLIDITKTEIERELAKSRKENEIMKERMKSMELEIAKFTEFARQARVELQSLKLKS